MTRRVHVAFPPSSPFRAVWGADAWLPVVRGEPELVADLTAGFGREAAYCWLIDVFSDDAGDPATMDRLIWAMVERWGVHPGQVSAQILETGGLYVLACRCWNAWAPAPCREGGRCRG